MCDCYDFSGLIIDFGVSIDCGELVGKNLRNCSQIVGLSDADRQSQSDYIPNAIPDPQCCSDLYRGYTNSYFHRHVPEFAITRTMGERDVFDPASKNYLLKHRITGESI